MRANVNDTIALSGYADRDIAGGGAQSCDGRALIAVEAAQRAVDVEVGGVNESH